MPTNSELRARLAEALPSVNCSVNKWAERSCAIAQKSFRFPSGAIPTKVQVDETFSKWKQQEQLAARITAALEDKGDGRDTKDAERFRKLQNMPPLQAQALFWNISSRKQRAAAIDKLPPTAGKEGVR